MIGVGLATDAFADVRVEPPLVLSDPIVVPPASAEVSATRKVGTQGVTFAEPVAHGVFGNGFENDMWVLPTRVVAHSPAFASRGGRPANGAMLNPGWNRGIGTNADTKQGFVWRTSSGPLHIAYDDTQRTELPVDLVPGDCLVICHSREQAITSGAGGYSVHRFLFVHCVAEPPSADSFAPPPIWPRELGQPPIYRFSDIDLSKLPSVDTSGFSNQVPAPGKLLPSSEGYPQLRVLDNIPFTYRENMKQTDGDHQGWANTYSHKGWQDIVDPILAYICTDASNAEKEGPLKFLIQRAIDTYGVIRNARHIGQRPYNADGGWNSCRAGPVVVAGHLLGDDTMRDFIGQNYRGDRVENNEFMGDYHMRAYLTADVIRKSREPGWKGNSQRNGRSVPYETSMAGVPEWVGRLGGSGIPFKQINNTWDGNNPNFYRNVGHANASAGEAAALELMGLRGAFDHDAWLDYQLRDCCLRHDGDDPWRYPANGSGPTFRLIDDAPNGGSPNSFRRELYKTHVRDVFDWSSIGLADFPQA